MPDIRGLPNTQSSSSLMYPDGKLIYELTSASALKDTDLFAISTSNNLTRNVSLKQIKDSVNNEFYNKTEIDNLYDILRKQINKLSDDVFDLSVEINNFEQRVNQELQDIDQRITDEVRVLNTRIDNEVNTLNARIDNEVETLNNRITKEVETLNKRIDREVETINTLIETTKNELEKMIREWIMYGTAVPTKLDTGRVYLQYF